MTGNRIALDTNQAVHLLNDVKDVVQWLASFDQLCIPVPVIGELRFGAMRSGRPQVNLSRIDALIARCTVLELTEQTSAVYARIRSDLARKGRPIPENDVWISAACVEHSLPVATDDAHFALVDGLQVQKGP